MTVCGKVICFETGVYKKKKLLKSKGNLCSIFFKIQTILALNVWQKICLEFS